MPQTKKMTNDEEMPNDGRAKHCVIRALSLIRHSSFGFRHLPNTHRACNGFELLDVFVGLLNALAALLLNDLAQRSIDIFGHPPRIATHEKVRAFGVDPFPNFDGVSVILCCT